MAFAGGLGARIELSTLSLKAPQQQGTASLLFSESNSRFLCEVPAESAAEFEQVMAEVPCARIGEVNDKSKLQILHDDELSVIDADIQMLKDAWKAPLKW